MELLSSRPMATVHESHSLVSTINNTQHRTDDSVWLLERRGLLWLLVPARRAMANILVPNSLVTGRVNGLLSQARFQAWFRSGKGVT